MPKWRNGRRKGLKILRWKHHAGSSPALGTRCDGFIRLFLYAVALLFSAVFSSVKNNRPQKKAPRHQTNMQKNTNILKNEKFVFFYRIFDLINLLINEFISRRQKISYQSAYDGSIAFNSSNESISVIRSLSTG